MDEQTPAAARLAAVIDIGSHAARLVIGELGGPGQVRIVESLWSPVSLGSDTFGHGFVRNATVAALIQVLRNFHRLVASYAIAAPVAVFTSSLRDAANADMLVERVRTATGLVTTILEPMDEALALYRALVAGPLAGHSSGDGNVQIVFARSGVTQSVFRQDGDVIFFGSRNEGALRWFKSFNLPDTAMRRVLPFVSTETINALKTWYGIDTVDHFIAVNDDLSDLLGQAVPEFHAGTAIPAEEFFAICERLGGMRPEAMASSWNIPETTVETMRITLLVLGILLRESGARDILVPRLPLTGAMLLALSARPGPFPESLRDDFHDGVLSSARALGRKYRYNAGHAEATRRIAVMLFEALRPLANFGPREQLLLEVAALLHDIGSFVSAKAHHRHSASLIVASEILGLSQQELLLISQIARFHRKGLPGGTAVEYRALDDAARLVVFRLAAILRIADALGEPAFPEIERLDVETVGETCVLRLALAGHRYEALEIMRVLVANKRQFFENYFGLALVLERFPTLAAR